MSEQHHTESSGSTERQHHEMSPSKFPMWTKCPTWESDGGTNEAMERGTRLHDEFQSLIESRQRKGKHK